jgi:mannosylglycoprotein endo-beta-mannosidase
MGLVSYVKYSVLLNGARLEEFKPTRGIWQGDLDSPYLFIVAVEGLSCVLKKSVIEPHGIPLAQTVPPISHLLFAHDNMLLDKSNGENEREISFV